jgi:hypothetical protein
MLSLLTESQDMDARLSMKRKFLRFLIRSTENGIKAKQLRSWAATLAGELVSATTGRIAEPD